MSIRNILYKEFRSWLEEVSGMTLADQVDMSCAKYQYTGMSITVAHLLVSSIVSFFRQTRKHVNYRKQGLIN